MLTFVVSGALFSEDSSWCSCLERITAWQL